MGRIQNSTEKPADEMGQRNWLHEGVLATVLLGIGQGCALFSLLLISRRILPSEFGKLSAELALQNYLVLLGTLGLRTLVVRDLARSPNKVSEIWGTYWAMIAPFGAIVALGGHAVAGLIFDRSPAEATMSLWLAWGALFSMLSVVPLLDGLHRQVQALGIVALTEGLFLTGLLAQLIPLNLTGLGAGFAIKWMLASLLQAMTALELAAAEKDEHAITQFEEARRLDPNLKGIAHPLAVLYDRQGRLDAAQREYERVLQEDPRNADVLNDYGYFLYSRGDFARARQQLNQAIARNAQHPKARINLAMVLAAEERYDEAFGHFEQALGPAAAHHSIGLLQMRAGRQQEAIAHLQQSAATDPSLRSDQLLATLIHTISPESRIMPVGFTQTQDETR